MGRADVDGATTVSLPRALAALVLGDTHVAHFSNHLALCHLRIILAKRQLIAALENNEVEEL